MTSKHEENPKARTIVRSLSRIIEVDFSGAPSKNPRAQETETLARFLPTYHMEFPDEALYGIGGTIVKKLMPETETHPAAILFHILARFGNIIGRTAFTQMESTRHYCNIFVVLAGATAKARKGTANDRVEDIFSGIDPAWESTRQVGGFGSGEGVINSIRDDQEITVKGKTHIVEGIEDKRLFIREGEFSRILAVGKREGNLLSQVLRDAWDSKTLRNTVKNSPQTATDPHISAVCDITQHEINLRLEDADRYNGFANRFLWAFVERTKLKPFGGNDIDWSHERKVLRKAVSFARRQTRIFMTEPARVMWRRKYAKLSEAAEGIVGGITSRAETQVLRLALIFALLDCKTKIWSAHLQAALALWDYSLRSVEHIFASHGVISIEQQRILDEVANGPTSITELREIVFKRNRPKDLIQADVDALAKKNLVSMCEDENGVQMWTLG
jgi:hypothetical protein